MGQLKRRTPRWEVALCPDSCRVSSFLGAGRWADGQMIEGESVRWRYESLAKRKNKEHSNIRVDCG